MCTSCDNSDYTVSGRWGLLPVCKRGVLSVHTGATNNTSTKQPTPLSDKECVNVLIYKLKNFQLFNDQINVYYYVFEKALKSAIDTILSELKTF